MTYDELTHVCKQFSEAHGLEARPSYIGNIGVTMSGPYDDRLWSVTFPSLRAVQWNQPYAGGFCKDAGGGWTPRVIIGSTDEMSRMSTYALATDLRRRFELHVNCAGQPA